MAGKAYKVLKADGAADKTIVAGDTVYYCTGHDYGIAADDTRRLGVHHVSMTRDPSGDYPFFTIPRQDLEEIKADG